MVVELKKGGNLCERSKDKTTWLEQDAWTVTRNICKEIATSYWILNDERLNLQRRQQHQLSTITPIMCHRGWHCSWRNIISATTLPTTAPPCVKVLTTAPYCVDVSKTAWSHEITQIPTAWSQLLPSHQNLKLRHRRVLWKSIWIYLGWCWRECNIVGCD